MRVIYGSNNRYFEDSILWSESYVKLNVSGALSNSGSNTFAGYNSGNDLANGAVENTFYGASAGKAVTTGDQNVFVGSLAGQATTTSSYNTAVGTDTLRFNIIPFPQITNLIKNFKVYLKVISNL